MNSQTYGITIHTRTGKPITELEYFWFTYCLPNKISLWMSCMLIRFIKEIIIMTSFRILLTNRIV